MGSLSTKIKSMSSKSPIFSMPKPQHFTDYGFEPQIHYFQVLGEAHKHKKESLSRSTHLRFKLQKPISKDESSKKIKKRWWRNLFSKFPKWAPHGSGDMGGRRRHNHCVGSIQRRPVYITESRSGSSKPYRTTSRPGSGPLGKGEMNIPYVSLRDLNMDGGHRISAAAAPIYLVT